MEILLLVIPIAAFSLLLRLRAFESTFAVLIGLPILVFPFGYLIPLNWISYLTGLIILCAIAIYLQPRRASKEDAYDWKNEAEPIIVFILLFILCFALCNLWPDFISIGERLRDYAILASVLHSPVELQEPWLSDFPLNYYVFWYRFGSIFHEIFNMPVWRVYPALQSFTYALYCSSAYYIFRRILSFSWTNALFCTLLIGFGSNVDGVISAFTNDSNWWGPSRVIAGAITEFPVWSFILGDLHPHYINLPVIAFFLVLLLPVLKQGREQLQSVFIASCAFILIPLFLYNSNAWEVPFWLMCAAAIALFLLIKHFGSLGWDNDKIKEVLTLKPFLVLLLMFYGALSLFLSSRHLVPADAPLRFVRPPIPETTTLEVFKHFGFPLTLISLATIALIKNHIYKLIAVIMLGATLLHSDGGLFMYALFALTVLRLLLEYQKSSENIPSDLTLAFEALGLASLALVLFPEFFFVDDAYGGENERMNTIFKIYTLNWLLIHLFGFYLAGRVLSGIKTTQEVFAISKIFQLAILVVFLAFFQHTIQFRKSDAKTVPPKNRGLSTIEKEFRGAAATIKKLEALPDGTVLEAQGNPYSYTTHVATLAGKKSFLGWANHVQLLNRAYEEIGRREKVTDEFYKSDDCLKRKEILNAEKIRYAVVGPLEEKRYPEGIPNSFDCMNNVIAEGDYKVYSMAP